MAEQTKKSKYNFGGHELDAKLYLQNMRDNAETFLNSKTDWTPEQKEEWKHAYTNFTNALQEDINNGGGRFSTDEFGTITDTKGEFSNTDSDNYYYNNKGQQISQEDYDALKERKQGKYQAFEANRQFASYANQIGKGLREALAAKNKTSDDTNGFDYAKNGFDAYWQKKYNPAGTANDLQPYWNKDKEGEYTNRVAETMADLDDYMSKQEMNDDVKAAYTNYRNILGQYTPGDKNFNLATWKNNMILAASRAGISRWNNGYFNIGSQSTTPTEDKKSEAFDINNDQAVIDKYKLADQIAAHPEQREHLLDLARRQYDQESQNITDEYNAAIKQKQEIANNKIWQQYLANEGKGYANVSKRNFGTEVFGNGWQNGNTDFEYASGTSQEAIRRLQNAFKTGNRKGDFLRTAINLTVNGGKQKISNLGEALAYYKPLLDKTQGGWDQFEKVQDAAGNEIYKLKGSENAKGQPLYIWFKNGKAHAYRDDPYSVRKAQIIARAQLGMKLQTRTEKEVAKEKENKKALSNPNTPEDKKRQIAGQRRPGDTEFTATDIARISAAGMDVASALSAFVPVYGTAISAGSGLISSLTNFGADMFDKSVSAGDMWKNLGANIAMDAVGLVPGFGTAGKAGKITKTLIKYVPKIVTVLSAANALSPESRASWAKLASKESLTVKDWQNISAGCSALVGVSRGVVGHLNARTMARGTKTKDFNITASDGKQYKVTAEQLETLKKQKSLEDINKEFKKLHPNAELSSFFRNGKWQQLRHLHFNNPQVKSVYDFSRLNNQGTFSNSNIWKVARENNLRGISLDIKNPYKNSLLKQPTSSSSPKGKYERSRATAKSKQQIFNSPLNNSPERYNYVRRSVQSNTGDEVKTWRDIFTKNHFYFKEGGSIQKLANGNNINGNPSKQNSVGYANDYNWNTDVFSKNLDHILGNLKQYKNGYANWLNTMQDLHYNDYTNASKQDYLNTNAYNNTTVGQYQDKYKAGYEDEWNVSPEGNDPDGLGYNILGIKSAQDSGKFGIVSGNANSGDWLGNGNMYKTDNSFGGITDARRLLGREGDFNDEQLKQYQQKFKEQGYDFYLDPNTKYYKLKPYIDPSKTTVADENNKSKQSNNFSLKNVINKMDVTDKWGIPRAMYADITNRKVTDMLKKQPILYDPQEDHRYIQSDLDAEMNGQQAAAQLTRTASHPITSDGNLQSMLQLEAASKGNEAITAGRQQSNQRLREMQEQAWQQELANYTNRHDVAMKNRESLYNTANENKALEAAYLNQKFTVWDVLAQEKEFKDKSDYERMRARADQFAQGYINNAIKLGQWDKVLSATRQTQQDLLGEYYGIPKSKYWTIRQSTPLYSYSTEVKEAKKGAKLNLRKVREAAKGEKLAAAQLKAQTADADRFYKTTKDHIDRMYDAINRLTNYSSTKRKRKKKS